MRHRKVRRALLTLGVITALLPASGTARAQVADPVDDARQERDQAQETLDAAEAQRDRAADARRRADSRLSLVTSDLGSAVRSYQQVNAELQQVTFRIAELRDEIIDREGTVRDLRRAAVEYVTAAYMEGGADEFGTLFAADTFAELVTTRTVLNRATEVSIAAVGDLVAGRRELLDLHAEHDLQESALRSLNEESARVVRALDELFAQATGDAGVAADELDAARLAVAEADARFQAATRKLEEEIEKRRRMSRGVDKWRPLVEHYFPPHLVWQALAVMSCESSGVATATHASSGAAGLFQFMAGTWTFASAEAGFAGFSPYDPEANVASAAWLVDYSIRTNHPWGPWGRWSCRTVLY